MWHLFLSAILSGFLLQMPVCVRVCVWVSVPRVTFMCSSTFYFQFNARRKLLMKCTMTCHSGLQCKKRRMRSGNDLQHIHIKPNSMIGKYIRNSVDQQQYAIHLMKILWKANSHFFQSVRSTSFEFASSSLHIFFILAFGFRSSTIFFTQLLGSSCCGVSSNSREFFIKNPSAKSK